jgi:hypothetical protein
MIVVHSPVQNQTYNSTNVWLNFTIIKPELWFAINVAHHADHSPITQTFVNITSIHFTVDGDGRQNIPVHDIDSLFDTAPTLNLSFSTMFPLAVGAHAVKVGLEADSYYVVSYVYNVSEALSSVRLYAESDVVNFTVVGPSEPSTIVESPEPIAVAESSEPSTVVEPPESGATNFIVTESPEPSTVGESFPTTLIVSASAATIAVLGAGLLVHFKKRKL